METLAIVLAILVIPLAISIDGGRERGADTLRIEVMGALLFWAALAIGIYSVVA